MDAQSVPNASSAEMKGYDAGKQISGIKRHIAVDTNGLPHAIHITAANGTDRGGAITMIEKTRQNMGLVRTMLADGGYTGTSFQETIKALIGADVVIAKRNELHTFVVIPQRWVVERSFSWLEKCRRLWRNCERLIASSRAMMQLAFIRILLKRR